MNKIKKISLIWVFLTIILSNCGLYKKNAVDYRKEPTQATDRARKNVEEGRGISLGGIINRKTTYEFSSSNPMWRASLEVLDFLPLSTVDYSGGLIITDWYSDNNNVDESIKITIRFLDNEIKSDSLKILVHQKICKKDNSCITKVMNSNLVDELKVAILRNAAVLEKNSKQ